jgi:cytochrome c biogenesis protein CcmG, thiol:disulfide interchange protein DsbE
MRWRRVAWTVIGTLPLLAILVFGMSRDPRALPSTLPGQAAPGFALRPLGQRQAPPITLSGMRGRVVVINFWASWCLACRDEHRILARAADRHAGTGVQFLGVLYNDTAENGLAWIRDLGGQRYPALADPGARTAIDFGLYGVPETFFIGRDGRVAHRHVGPITEAVLDEWIDRLTPGRRP